ncbi:MucBP domain-containing protein [Isobaculum melis]|uniref:LPXTG-motif cell wall anchor domain-containing protein n=1 Tax=Isobaculum melis TaxID=142588 RepID=A0A1H9TDR7_9LACT|nr:MucBP domain-containing protein [Isobaculum melis]SER95301.1 LPXTG-motif cell wall anchor domain-containing protein [Isobaculum melis]
MLKKIIFICFILIGLVLPQSAEAATNIYAPYSSDKANTLGTELRVNDVLNDYSIPIPIAYHWTSDEHTTLDYLGLTVSSNMYAKFEEGGIVTTGFVPGTDFDPLVGNGISEPVYLLPVPEKMYYDTYTKYFHYYVVQTLDSQYPKIGNNYALQPGDLLPTNLNFAWAYYSDSPGIQVNYVTDRGEVLEEGELYVGELEDTVPQVPKTFPGYILIQRPGATFFTTDKQSIDYVYQRIPESTVTASYVDENGNKIADDIVEQAQVGTPYTTTQLAIDGYIFQLIKDNIPENGLYTEAPIQVVYVYQKIPDGTVTASYIDENGNKIAPDIIETKRVGTPYATSQLAIEGYTFQLIKDNVPENGFYTEAPIQVVYIYTKNPIETSVIVEYIDENGQEIHSPQAVQGNVGESYDVSGDSFKLLIDGYQLMLNRLPDRQVGEFTEQIQRVIYIYQKIIEDKEVKKIDVLPHTGETTSNWSLAIGGILLIIAIVYYFYARKK